MPHPTMDKLRRMLDQTVDPDTYPELADEFTQMTLHVPQVQDPDIPEGKRGFAMFGDDDARLMYAYTEASLVDPELLQSGMSAYEINGLIVLKLAQAQRFSLSINDDASEVFLPHQILLLICEMLLLNEPNQTSQPVNLQDAAQFYPKAYARWLGDYCRKHPEISKAWLALVAFGNKAIPDICVVFDEYTPKRHLEHARWQTIGLLPQQLIWEHELSDSREKSTDRPDPISSIRSNAPLYDKSQPQGWWARFRRRPTPI
ncbi:MAG: hypothetical protein ACTS5I_10700, partial [Rhodanobacter sp.]